jgi:hypothetical protein
MLLKVVERPDLEEAGLIGLQKWKDGALQNEYRIPMLDRQRVASFLRDWAAQIVAFFAPKKPALGQYLMEASSDGPRIHCRDAYTQALTSLPVEPKHDVHKVVGAIRLWLEDGSSVENPAGEAGIAPTPCGDRDAMHTELVKELRRLEDVAAKAEAAEIDAKNNCKKAQAEVKFMVELIARLFPERKWITTT